MTLELVTVPLRTDVIAGGCCVENDNSKDRDNKYLTWTIKDDPSIPRLRILRNAQTDAGLKPTISEASRVRVVSRFTRASHPLFVKVVWGSREEKGKGIDRENRRRTKRNKSGDRKGGERNSVEENEDRKRWNNRRKIEERKKKKEGWKEEMGKKGKEQGGGGLIRKGRGGKGGESESH
ncbi:hypothetical protein Tco_1174508 [Tanacetum coccineum]